MIHFLGRWINAMSAVFAREIGQCCARLEIDINKLVFKFKDDREITEQKQLSRVNKMKDKTKKKNKDSLICDSVLCNRRKTFITYGLCLISFDT